MYPWSFPHKTSRKRKRTRDVDEHAEHVWSSPNSQRGQRKTNNLGRKKETTPALCKHASRRLSCPIIRNAVRYPSSLIRCRRRHDTQSNRHRCMIYPSSNMLKPRPKHPSCHHWQKHSHSQYSPQYPNSYDYYYPRSWPQTTCAHSSPLH